VKPAALRTRTDGDPGWVGGVNMALPPHMLQSGQIASAVNVRFQRDGTIAHRPGYAPVHLDWGGVDPGDWWSDQGYQSAAAAHGSDDLFVMCYGRVFHLRAEGLGFRARCLSPMQVMRACGPSWAVGVAGGVVFQDGVNRPIMATASGIRRAGVNLDDTRVGRQGIYVQGYYVYVSQDGCTLLVADIGDPLRMRESVDENIYGWNALGKITGLSTHMVYNNDVEMGNVVYSAGGATYTVDLRGPRGEWGLRQGRVSVFMPNISIAGHRAVTVMNSNVVFLAAEAGVGLCGLNQSAAAFQRFDTFSSQFPASEPAVAESIKALVDAHILVAHGGDLLLSAFPTMRRGRVMFSGFLAYGTQPSGEAGLAFQGYWTDGPWIVDAIQSRSGIRVFGSQTDGTLGVWTFSPLSVDRSLNGAVSLVRSTVFGRALVHGEYWVRKHVLGGSVVFRDTVNLSFHTGSKSRDAGGWIAGSPERFDTRREMLRSATDWGASHHYAAQLAITWDGCGRLETWSCDAEWTDPADKDSMAACDVAPISSHFDDCAQPSGPLKFGHETKRI
jgi:hypothetical protein